MKGHFEVLFDSHTNGAGTNSCTKKELTVKCLPRQSQLKKWLKNVCQVSLKRLQYLPRTFEKRMYNPKMLHINLLHLFIFSWRSQGRSLELARGKKKTASGLKINAKMRRYRLVYIICEKAEGKGKKHLHRTEYKETGD